MRGKRAKEIRKVAANPQLSETPRYRGIEHKKTMYRATLREDGMYEYEPVDVTRIQVILGPCQRKSYRVWKNRYNHFHRRSDTLPNVGLNCKHMM